MLHNLFPMYFGRFKLMGCELTILKYESSTLEKTANNRRLKRETITEFMKHLRPDLTFNVCFTNV
jgi:hypothetical protein